MKVRVVCTIEAKACHLLGALIQHLSLRQASKNFEFHLVVARDRSSTEHHFVSQRLERCCQSIGGIHVHSLEHRADNPFLNKWAGLDRLPAWPSDEPILMLDWDIVAVRPDSLNLPLPALPLNVVAARFNPTTMYDQYLHGLSEVAELPDFLSINSGVIFGCRAALRNCARLTHHWHEQILSTPLDSPHWLAEQMAACLAVSDIGCHALDADWNVTPLSQSEDSSVVLWHYNDGDPTTREVKTQLHRPQQVLRLLHTLRDRWPSCVEQFLALYEDVLSFDAVRSVLAELPED